MQNYYFENLYNKNIITYDHDDDDEDKNILNLQMKKHEITFNFLYLWTSENGWPLKELTTSVSPLVERGE